MFNAPCNFTYQVPCSSPPCNKENYDDRWHLSVPIDLSVARSQVILDLAASKRFVHSFLYLTLDEVSEP